MAAQSNIQDPRWTLAAVRDGTVAVPDDWSQAITDENLVGLTAVEPDLDLLYHRPHFDGGRDNESEGQSAVTLAEIDSTRNRLIVGSLALGFLGLVVYAMIREVVAGDAGAWDLFGGFLYTICVTWIAVGVILRTIKRTRLRFVPLRSAPYGVRAEMQIVVSRFMIPKTVKFSFQPIAILLVKRHYPGEENIPISHPRYHAYPWSDTAILAVGANSEFAVIGCHGNLDRARQILQESRVCREITDRGVPIIKVPEHISLSLPPRPPLPDEKRQWKREKSDIDIPPLTPEELCTLFDGLNQPNPNPCDHTFTQTIEVLQANNLPIEPTIDWLKRNGASCDCEVIYNTADEWGEWAQLEPEQED